MSSILDITFLKLLGKGTERKGVRGKGKEEDVTYYKKYKCKIG